MIDHGIGRVLGDDVLDLARRQGEQVATERTWQITLDAWRVRGTTAASLGPAAVGWDEFARRAALAEVAARAYDVLTGEDRAFVDAFTEGVNAGLARAGAAEFDTLGLEPVADWEPWMPCGIFLLNQVLFSSFPTKLWRARAAAAVGEEIVDLFRAEPWAAAGSNAWVIGGDRTATGLPLIAGDPHRLFEVPNCYQQVHLVCPEFDVAGFTFPGVPGVQHFAHTGEVAWGITNAMADYQDLVIEDPDDPEVSRRTAVIEVCGEGERRIELLSTPRGPWIADGLALRTPSGELGDLGFASLLPLLRAREVDDILTAFEHWVEPVNHLVVADRTGRAARRVVGRVPHRTGAAAERARWYPVPARDSVWSGWVSLPGADVAAEEITVTANQWLPGFDEFGVEFAPPYRAARITELLADRTGLAASDMAPIATDTVRPRSRLDGLLPRPVDEPTYRALRDRVVQEIEALPALAPAAALDGGFYAPWFALAPRIAAALDRILDAGDLLGFDARVLVAHALDQVTATGFEPVPTRLSAGHLLGEAGPTVPTPEVAGDPESVCAITELTGTGLAVRGPVARYVWDLADRSAGGWVVPFGASGDLAGPHGTDQLALWLTGGLVPLPSYPTAPQQEEA